MRGRHWLEINLGIKTIEYGHKFHEHLVPGAHFNHALADAPHQQLFFSFYFAMTGLHATHMIIGMVILAIFVVQVMKSDDVTRFRAMEGREVVGTSPDLTRHHMEVRGLGIINVTSVFGIGSVRLEKRLDLVGNGNLLPNLTNRHGQSLAIQVADGYGSANEKCNPPARIHWSQSNNNSLAGKLYLCPGE